MTTRSQTSPSGDVANQPMSPSQMSVSPSVQSGSGKGPKHSQPPVGTPGAGRSNLQATPVAQPTVAQPHVPQAQVHSVAAPVELPTPVVAAPVDAAVVSPTPSRRSRDQEEILDAIRALTMTLSNNQNHGQVNSPSGNIQEMQQTPPVNPQASAPVQPAVEVAASGPMPPQPTSSFQAVPQAAPQVQQPMSHVAGGPPFGPPTGMPPPGWIPYGYQSVPQGYAQGWPPVPPGHAHIGTAPVVDEFHIPVRDARFRDVLSVEAYRLSDRSETINKPNASWECKSITNLYNSLKNRMAKTPFNGDPPVSVLRFLQQLARVGQQAGASEGQMAWLLEDFTEEPITSQLRDQAFSSYPQAVHWLLLSYASEKNLNEALQELQSARQQQGETARMFGHRLLSQAGMLGNLAPLSQVKVLFGNGLKDPVRAMFQATPAPKEMDEQTPLTVLIARAEQLEAGMSSRQVVLASRTAKATPKDTPMMPMVPDARSGSPFPFSGPSRVALTDKETRLDQEWALMLAYSAMFGTNVRSSPQNWRNQPRACYVCWERDHFYRRCPLVVGLTDEQVSALGQRRRSFFAEIAESRMQPEKQPSANDDSKPTWVRKNQDGNRVDGVGWKAREDRNPTLAVMPALPGPVLPHDQEEPEEASSVPGTTLPASSLSEVQPSGNEQALPNPQNH